MQGIDVNNKHAEELKLQISNFNKMIAYYLMSMDGPNDSRMQDPMMVQAVSMCNAYVLQLYRAWRLGCSLYTGNL